MDKRRMSCPFCNNVFTITRQQMDNNTRFRCNKCKKYNQGSSRADANGVLIGLTKSDLYV